NPMGERKSRRIPLDLHGLSGRADLFRISRGLQRDPAVEAWLTDEPVELRLIAQRWFERMRECGDDVLELMHDGCPVACVEDAPFGYVNTFKSHVDVGFFNGAALDDPARLLQGSGKRMRHVKLNPGVGIDAKALGDLIAAAYANIKACLAAQRASRRR
ncbi:MAG TPA: DUF1801 domain-containing protein, partial [Steroidobacteraceae bacterium]|nr:DUF1801 domain-containing protein [Steroidobacteraceae bacterium]